MENKDNPHLKLAEMGAETWNRWARTLMDDVAIDALRLSDEKKEELKSISPLNNEEQVELAEELGLYRLDQLGGSANFEELKIGCNLSGFWFPWGAVFLNATISGGTNFFKATFSGNADFSQATFSRGANFSKATFGGYADFIKATFTMTADFSEAAFSGNSDFSEAAFSGNSDFSEARFSGSADFSEAAFSGNSDFSEARFSGSADFIKATFAGFLNFMNTSFNSTTFFKNTTFNTSPMFHNVDLHQNTSFHEAIYIRKTGNEDDARAWRTLKLAMNKIHNHDQELMFFKYEMDAKRVVLKSDKKYTIWAFISIYKWVSDYGTSVFRSLMTLTALCAVFTLVYTFEWMDQYVLSDYKKGFELSFANLVPFAPTSKAEVTAVLESIKGEGPGLQVVIVFQNLASTIMLFLIGLALKHRFSIK